MGLEEDYRSDQEKIKKLGALASEIAGHHAEYTTYSILKNNGKGSVTSNDPEWTQARTGLRDSLKEASKILEEIAKNYHWSIKIDYKLIFS